MLLDRENSYQNDLVDVSLLNQVGHQSINAKQINLQTLLADVLLTLGRVVYHGE